MIVQNIVSTRLDYCNSVLYGIADNQLQRLQSVQNAAARLVTGHRTTLFNKFKIMPRISIVSGFNESTDKLGIKAIT